MWKSQSEIHDMSIIILSLHHHTQREPGGQDLEPGASPLLPAHPPRLPFQQIAPPPHPVDRLGSKTHLQLLEEGRLCLASLEGRGRLQVCIDQLFHIPSLPMWCDLRWNFVREWPVLNTMVGWHLFHLGFICVYQVSESLPCGLCLCPHLRLPGDMRTSSSSHLPYYQFLLRTCSYSRWPCPACSHHPTQRLTILTCLQQVSSWYLTYPSIICNVPLSIGLFLRWSHFPAATFLLLLLIESVADQQQWEFQNEKHALLSEYQPAWHFLHNRNLRLNPACRPHICHFFSTDIFSTQIFLHTSLEQKRHEFR